jgi:hypothetical protein
MKLAPAILALAFATAPAAAGEPSPVPDDASLNNASDGPAWFANVSGVKLVAVDGSTLSLAPTEGGLSFALISQDGTAQKSSFAFLSDKLGTISDDADAGHINGFFRETDNGFEAQFADGRAESLVANIAGGLTLTLRNGADSTCTSWYPPDHVFSAAERRAALDAYAGRLGLGDKNKKAALHAAPICVPAIRVVKNNISAGNMQSLVVVTHLQADAATKTGISAKTDSKVKASSAAGLVPIVVRSSPVHLIDGTAASVSATPPLIQASASLGSATEPVLAKTPVLVASTQSSAVSAASTATVSKVPAGSGASDCLSVDSDGANLGFRNHCAYGVQFAYCLQRADDPAANCDAGSKTGAVSANGFAAVLLDTNIKTADAEHDFRWVACSGDAADVIAHIDRSDPPAGRCVRTGTL